MAEQEKKQIKVQVQLTDEKAQGNYSNLALVNHSENEFILDFLFLQPQAPKAKVNDRVILSPKNAKRLLMTLRDNIAKYEKRFGAIEIKDAGTAKMDLVH